MRRLLLALAVLGLLLVLPVASACSFAGSGPSLPARLWVWDLAEERILKEADVWTRGLAADCGLVKGHALDADRLAYADRAGKSMGVYVHTIGGDDPPRLVFRLNGDYGRLDLHGDLLTISMTTIADREDGPYFHHLLTVDLATGEAKRHALDPDGFGLGQPTVSDGLGVWAERDHDTDTYRFSMYDFVREEWIQENTTGEAFALSANAGLVDWNRDWLLFRDDDSQHIYHVPTRQLNPFDLRVEWLDGTHAYGWTDAGLTKYDLPQAEEVATFDRPPHPTFRGSQLDQDQIVLGAYSLPSGETRPSRPPGWITSPELEEDYPIPDHMQHYELSWWEQIPTSGGLAPVGLILLVVLAARRRLVPFAVAKRNRKK